MTDKPGSGGEGPDAPTGAAPGDGEAPPEWWEISGLHMLGEDYQAGLQQTPADKADTGDSAGNERAGGSGLIGHLQSMAEPVAEVIGSVLGAANDALVGEAPARARRLRRGRVEPPARIWTLPMPSSPCGRPMRQG